MKLKLNIPAKEASAGPPIGPAFGQAGLKAIDFVKQFNAETEKYNKGTLLRVKVNVLANKSYTFKISPPSLSSQISEIISKRTPREIISRELYELVSLRAINKAKIENEFNKAKIENEFNKARGTCRSMKVNIRYENKDENAPA